MSGEEKYDPKTFKMYMKVAVDTQDHSVLVSYFVTNFTVNKAVEYLKNLRAQGKEDPELTKDVQGWFMILEDLKRSLGNELNDREECKKQYYEYAYSYFLRADNKYRDDNYSPQLAQDFFYATVLLDAYTIFGPPGSETNTHKKYAKVARLKIMKAIKSGNLPVPKSQQNQRPADETEIPDDNTGGIRALGSFQAHQSIINKGIQNDYNNPYGNPYGQPYQAAPTSNAGGYGGFNNESLGQGNAGGLPNFAKFDGPSQSINAQNVGNNYSAQNNFNAGGNFNLGFGGNQAPTTQPSYPKSTQPRRNPEFFQKAEKAKDLCKKALGELEYKRVRQFKDNLEAALELLEAIEQS